jgi:hypothetical protein
MRTFLSPRDGGKESRKRNEVHSSADDGGGKATPEVVGIPASLLKSPGTVDERVSVRALRPKTKAKKSTMSDAVRQDLAAEVVATYIADRAFAIDCNTFAVVQIADIHDLIVERSVKRKSKIRLESGNVSMEEAAAAFNLLHSKEGFDSTDPVLVKAQAFQPGTVCIDTLVRKWMRLMATTEHCDWTDADGNEAVDPEEMFGPLLQTVQIIRR